jgi:Na+/H+-dicarboxylate symporter
LDMVRTAVNVTGDSVVSLVVAHSEKQFDESVFLDPNADTDANQGGTSDRELSTPMG